MSQENVPMPPLPLAKRAGVGIAKANDPYVAYEGLGAAGRMQILQMLPVGYELVGRRLLDFGCGAGRTLRHFLDEAESAEIWGCDIDAESIEWLEANLCPPLHVFRNEPQPGLAFPDGHFDLIWALSVFTHLVDDWAAWLLELHRVLTEDGILIATTLGPQHSESKAHEPWDEDRIGMNALRTWASYPAGAPQVLHSTWWLRAHWGRAFEILEIEETPVAVSHRWLAMRKRDLTLTVADLERPEPGELREFTAVRHHVRQLRRELEEAHEHDQQLREQQRLLKAMLGSRAFAVAEQLSRLHQRGQPVFSRKQIRRALGDGDGSA
jgi:SAM-dependent methyltransferase